MIAPALRALLLTSRGLARVDTFAPFLDQYMPAYGIATPAAIAMFIAQAIHESAEFTHLSENLNYSASGLSQYFGKYFTPTEAMDYARQPERIANRVYANRYGNKSEASGDGWKYRGRAIFGITFADNYNACGIAIKRDLRRLPELLEQQPDAAVESACWFWQSRGLNAYAGDIKECTRRINGGSNGLDERTKIWTRAKAVITGA